MTEQLLTNSVLVLNRNFIPIDTCSVREAIILLYKESAKVVDKEYNSFFFKEWIEYSSDIDGPKIHSPTITILVPEIITILGYTEYPYRNIILRYSRKNVFFRDALTCQYCNKKYPLGELTIDHVIPKSKGGKNVYENVVSACKVCNNRKRDRTPEESGMIPLNRPVTPSWYSKVRNHMNWSKIFQG